MALLGTRGGSSTVVPANRYAVAAPVASAPVVRAATAQSTGGLPIADCFVRTAAPTAAVTPMKSRSQFSQPSPPRQGPMRSKTAGSLLSGSKPGSITPLVPGSRPYTPLAARAANGNFTPISPKGAPGSFGSWSPVAPVVMSSNGAASVASVVAPTTSATPPATKPLSAAIGLGTSQLSMGSAVAPAVVARAATTVAPTVTPAVASATAPSFASQLGSSSVPTEPPRVSTEAGSTIPLPSMLVSGVGSITAAVGSVAVPVRTMGSLTVPGPQQPSPTRSTMPAIVAASTTSVLAPTPSAATSSVLAPVPTPPVASENFEEASNTQLLQAGTTVRIQGNLYRVTEPLGMGSFGAVWAAERTDGASGEVAIKEIVCSSKKELADAALEGRLLRTIHHARPQVLVGKVPDLVGTETVPMSRDRWVMRLAMTKVPGMQLDMFLEMCRAPVGRGPAANCSAAVATAAAVVAAQTQTLSGTCRFARNMLSQIAFIFECMAPIVHHRDVSPHNILIDVMHANGFQFGLVDFGLSSDLRSWQGKKQPGSWHNADIGGDCRYWPISVWVMFVSGSDELERLPGLAHEYQTRLDYHAVGITVLEIIMSTLPASALAVEEICALHSAWKQYWRDVTRFWKRTMEVFDSGEDPSSLKMWIRGEGRVADILAIDLGTLRSALRRAGQACRGSEPEAAQLFTTLLELVSNGGKSGQDEGIHRPNWQAIRSMLDAEMAPAPPVRSAAPIKSTPGSLLVAAGSSNAVSMPGSLLASVGPSPYSGSMLVPAAASPPLLSGVPGSMVVPAGLNTREWRRAGSPTPVLHAARLPLSRQYVAGAHSSPSPVRC